MTETPHTPETPAEPETDIDRLVGERYEKADRLAAAGTALYAHGYEPTCTIEDARKRGEELIASGEEIALAGRIIIVRSFGKAGFLVIRDGSGQIQFYVKQGITDEKGFEYYKTGLDGGDVVGARGKLFKSKTGELSLEAKELTLLTKSVRPLPEKWHGLTNVDIRYRQRYVDLIVNPQVAEVFKTRSRIISFMRNWLDKKGYMEVETPMMHPISGGAAAKPFVTHHNALDMDLYLRVAPELYLKRLIAGGFEKVYEINRNFRNEGLSTRHNPEFTMLELYTAWWGYEKTMWFTEQLISDVARQEHTSGPSTQDYCLWKDYPRVRILDAVAEALGISPHAFRWGLSSKNESKGFFGQQSGHPAVKKAFLNCATSDAIFMNLFEELVEPNLIRATFVIDFPKSLCPLAKSKPDDPHTAERFELFIGGMEIANAYSELNDPREQLANFESQVNARKAGDEEAMNQVDRDYVRALEYGMPPCSGLGIGIDRLVMLLTNSASIRDVILFPTMRPETQS